MEINPRLLIVSIATAIGLTTLVTKLTDRGAGKRNKIYERIEQERKDAENKYMSEKMCLERSGNIQEKLTKLEDGQATILTEVRKRNGM